MITKSLPKKGPVDKVFLWVTIILLGIGILAFVSASFGVLVKNQTLFYKIIFTQIFVGLILGSVGMWLSSRLPFLFWRKYAFWIFLGAIILTSLVFVPGVGYSHGGATRWVSILGFSFQPAEILKIAFIVYFSAWIAWLKPNKGHLKKIVVPFIILILIVAGILLKQPDTKSLILIVASSAAMLFAARVPWKYILGIFLVGIVGFGALVATTPYLKSRVQTFLDPTHDVQGSSWQLNQSIIAIGSGEVFGRGLGQSVQKFTYLPEPQGDSIFAVIGEEFGFVGSVIIIVLYTIFGLRGLQIAARAPDMFSRLLVTGLVILVVAQSFMNIASISGVFPLTGVPLVFMSHGGTALLFAMIAVGIILNVSKYRIKV